MDCFINLTISLPDSKVVSSKGYNQSEIDEMVNDFSEIKEDIIEYVKEKEQRSA